MKSLSMGVYGYAVASPCSVSFHNAKHKQTLGRVIPFDMRADTRDVLKSWNDCSTYAERKRLGVQSMLAVCEEPWLRVEEGTREILQTAKADDGADAMAQALHWLLTTTKKRQPRRVISIDIGMRNLAVCVCEECDTKQPEPSEGTVNDPIQSHTDRRAGSRECSGAAEHLEDTVQVCGAQV